MKFAFTIAENDQAMSLIFGNLRNLIVCATLFGVAGWSFQDPGRGWVFTVHMLATLALFSTAVILTTINFFHGLLKIKGLPHPRTIKGMLAGTYLSLGVSVLEFLVSQFHLH